VRESRNRYSLVVDSSGTHGDPEQPDDEFQLALAASDFREAITVLMRRHGTHLYRFCLDLLRARDAAQDTLKLVFLQAFEALPRYEPRTTARAWLFGIARHRCRDTLKGRRFRLRLVRPEASLPEAPGPAESSERSLLRSELREALRQCLDELPGPAREVVYLRCSAQLSYDEIAELSGELPGTLRVRVARALPVLRDCLERKGMAA
jgi:RNA polymerase sigma-70 factor (ECF subfamily)